MIRNYWKILVIALGASLVVGTVVVVSGRSGEAQVPAPAQVGPEVRGPRTVRLDAATLERLRVRVSEAGSASEALALELQGTLDWDRDHYAEVGARLDGRVTRLNARIGDRVNQGANLGQVAAPQLGTALADFVSARATLVAAQSNARRQSSLLSQQLTTAREAEVAQEHLHQAEAGVASARQRLGALGLSTPQNTTSIANDVHFTLVSPIRGTVVARRAVLGGFLSASDAAFVIADTQQLWAMIDVFESDLRYVNVGAEVSFSVDAYPDRTFTGRVEYIEPQQDEASRATRVRVVVPNPDGLLRHGQFVRARLQVPGAAANARTVRVPVEAIQPVGDGEVVFVERAQGQFEVRTVRVARRGPQVAELAEGLQRGERIVTEGAFLLRGELLKQ
ncbi:MAG: efflux RND transporter periplasmic adaptor subunit [Myxococcales bacterium]|nr:efflux RND transporter periplasmic adaptor subunit [Myxococcales bacterium]